MSEYAQTRRETTRSAVARASVQRAARADAALPARGHAARHDALAEALNRSARVQSLAQMKQMLDASPRMQSQRALQRALNPGLGGAAIQREATPDEEELAQAEFEPAQRQTDGAAPEAEEEEEETLQGKSAAVQRESVPDEDETLQGKFAPVQLLNNNPGMTTQAKPATTLSGTATNAVVQLMKPTELNRKYVVKTETGNQVMYFTGAARKEDNYRFKLNPTSMLTYTIHDNDVLQRAPDEAPIGPVTPALAAAPTIESETHSDEEEEEKISLWRTRGPTREKIEQLLADVKEFPPPPGHEGVWRFFDKGEEYESHRYQAAQEKQGSVSDEELAEMRESDVMKALHMYKSSGKSNSAGISYSRDLDQLLDQSFHVGADSALQKTIHGEGGATYLAYTHIPTEDLFYPEDLEVPAKELREGKEPMSIQQIDRMKEARLRAISEKEALHVPRAGTAGRAPAPVMVFPNPFKPQINPYEFDMPNYGQASPKDPTTGLPLGTMPYIL